MVWILTLILSFQAWASPLQDFCFGTVTRSFYDCNAIGSEELKALCFARATPTTRVCRQMQHSDWRLVCLSQTNQSHCADIRDPRIRIYCEATTLRNPKLCDSIPPHSELRALCKAAALEDDRYCRAM